MELVDQHIFILALPRFDNGLESTNYFVAKELAKNNQVYYIDNPYTFSDYIKFKGSSKYHIRKPFLFGISTSLLDTIIPNLKIIITPIIPSLNFLPENPFYRTCLKVSEYIIRRRIKAILKKRKIESYIYINSANFHYPGVSNGLNPKLRVYHCMDPLIIPFDVKHGTTSEKQLVKSSDLVICTSKQLFKENKQLNANSFFIPNAVDISQSSKALDIELPIHKSLKGIKKPIIGYFGNIERRMDFDLLKDVCKRNQDKSFVFCGPVSAEFAPNWFYSVSNIYLIEAIPYCEMPSLIKGFDVALIPFKKDNVSRTIFPLKLFEYLGAGKPVVATDFNLDLKEFTRDSVFYCSNSSSFSEAITEALQNNDSNLIEERLEIAKENTWEKRVQAISELIAIKISTNGHKQVH